MQNVSCEILLRQPAYSLELLRSWDEAGEACHTFILYPAVNGRHSKQTEGVSLMTGKGHDVSRCDMHYALYLFQRFHLNQGAVSQAVHG
jgi:hypothetical protein